MYSSVMRDQPLPPGERGAFWVEHVIKHGGGRHLRSRAFELSFYQYHNLDVYLVLACGSVFILGLSMLCCKCLFKRVGLGLGLWSKKDKIKKN